ncbi:MAG: cupin domain-containing protein [Silicimonas sp.]|nr:cupin domain-containing protein [Silicimonas sp.]
MGNLLFVTAMALTTLATHVHAEQIRLLGSDDFEWRTTTEGVGFAALRGDRFVESYQALVRLPAGTVSPPHVKTANMFGVMLEGEMIHYAIDDDPEDARRMGPGSFYSIAAGTEHISACVSETPCVAYLYQDGAFDFLPVTQ